MSLLTIVSEVCGRLDLPVPSAVAGSTDAQVVQLQALANKAGRDLASDYAWQTLVAEQTFTTTNTSVQSGAIPPDLDRFIPNSFFNRSTRRPIVGPVTPQQWQWLIAQPSFSTVYLMYRERGGEFLIGPPTVAPPAGQTMAFEYVSVNWAKSASGTPQASFQADTDTAYLDEGLIADATVWMFLRAKGMSYAEEMATYERNLEKAKARDGGSTELSIVPTRINLSRANVPDGSWPSA